MGCHGTPFTSGKEEEAAEAAGGGMWRPHQGPREVTIAMSHSDES